VIGLVGLAQLAVAAGVAATPVARPARTAADSAPPPPADRWLGADKARHFFLAGFAESAAFAAARAAGAGRRPALAVSALAAGGISIGKELVDRAGRGQASVRDLFWDVAGIAAYGALLARTTR
jgi:uncharacterized protein YfiM (DUF2279 family)